MSDSCTFEFTRSDARARFDLDGIEEFDDLDEYWTALLDNRGVDGDVWNCPHDAVDGEACPFHGGVESFDGPTATDDGETVPLPGTERTIDGDAQVRALERAIEEVRSETGGPRDAQFVGARFGDVDLSDTDLSLPGEARLDFLGATFTGEVVFERCTLAEPTFAHAAFEGDARFDDATFHGRTYFDDVQFAASARLADAMVTGTVSFDGADFEGRTVLTEVDVEGDVSLDEVDCADWTSLYETTVGGDVESTRATFRNDVFLTGVEVDGDLSLTDWTCYGLVMLSDAHVDGQLVVKESRFYHDEADADVDDPTDTSPADGDLDSVQFDGVECDFFALLDSVFFRPVDCSDVTTDDLYLSETDFVNEVNLGSARVSTLGTRDCWFGGYTRMINARIERSEFERTDFDGLLDAPHVRLTNTGFLYCTLNTVRFSHADLSGADLSGLDLRGADLSSATLSRAVLDGADLRGADLSGTALAGVHVDDETTVLHPPVGEFDETHRIPRGLRAAIPFVSTGGSYCGPDPAFEPPEVEGRDVSWPKTDESAAKTLYRRIETIAGDHARSRLQSRAFVRGQDLRYAQLREREPVPKIRYWFSRLQRGVFVYGESFARVVVVSLLIILTFGLLYPLGGWTSTVGPDGATTPLTYARVAAEPTLLWRSVYHSAMMFATGNRYGGIEATTTLSQAITSVEALLGPTMLALVVFVLGRRAAR